MKISMRVRERIQQVGFVFLLLLMGFVIINDVTKFAPGLLPLEARSRRRRTTK